MDVIFDIDGTLADATHRLHFIKDMNFWVAPYGNPLVPRKPNWDAFLDEEQVSKDGPIIPTFQLLNALHNDGHKILFATGRNETTRISTQDWITHHAEEHAFHWWLTEDPKIYMRSSNDRRPSHDVKRDLLKKIREDGHNPVLVFEDRKDDTAMWRSEGLLCCQVAEGNY